MKSIERLKLELPQQPKPNKKMLWNQKLSELFKSVLPHHMFSDWSQYALLRVHKSTEMKVKLYRYQDSQMLCKYVKMLVFSVRALQKWKQMSR